MAIKKTIANHIDQQFSDSFFQHHNPYEYRPVNNKFNIIKDGDKERVEEMREVIVHQFLVEDFEDPDIHAAEPLIKWEKSEQGQWVMKNACEVPAWYRLPDPATYQYRYQIRAKFMGKALTEWMLKYSR